MLNKDLHISWASHNAIKITKLVAMVAADLQRVYTIVYRMRNRVFTRYFDSFYPLYQLLPIISEFIINVLQIITNQPFFTTMNFFGYLD